MKACYGCGFRWWLFARRLESALCLAADAVEAGLDSLLLDGLLEITQNGRLRSTESATLALGDTTQTHARAHAHTRTLTHTRTHTHTVLNKGRHLVHARHKFSVYEVEARAPLVPSIDDLIVPIARDG